METKRKNPLRTVKLPGNRPRLIEDLLIPSFYVQVGGPEGWLEFVYVLEDLVTVMRTALQDEDFDVNGEDVQEFVKEHGGKLWNWAMIAARVQRDVDMLREADRTQSALPNHDALDVVLRSEEEEGGGKSTSLVLMEKSGEPRQVLLREVMGFAADFDGVREEVDMGHLNSNRAILALGLMLEQLPKDWDDNR